MPMESADGAVALAYNGELYNDPELRSRLEAAGTKLRSLSDTELVLSAYEQFGEDFVDHLDGMFALALWDHRRQQMVVARDRFGVKPLYYTVFDGKFACASEVKALLALDGVKAAVDPVALQQYLTFLWVPDPLTMFAGIRKLEAGQIGVFKGGELSIRTYWDLDFPSAVHRYPRAEADLVDEFRSTFYDAVHRQMVSDVPIGSFLSAGLDSSSIVAAMAEHSSSPIRTFTINFPSARQSRLSDDATVAARTAKHFGCDHRQIDVEPDVVDLLPKLVWHLDEPIADPAAIVAYLVNRAAREDVTVLMSGVGGDELLAGYRKHIAQIWGDRYRMMPAWLRQRAIPSLAERVPAMPDSRLGGTVRLAKKMARSGALDPDDMFLMNSTYFTNDAVRRLVKPDVWAAMKPFDAWARHREHFAKVSDADPLNRLLYLDTKAFMVSLNLTYNDKASMAASTEVRVPFLDRRLAEFMATQVPPDMKLHGTTRPVTKYLLRQAMKDVLPGELLHQPKAGFGAPVGKWLNEDLAPMIADLLSDERVEARGWFEPTEVRRIITRHRAGRDDNSLQIWALLTFELWQQQFLDANPATAAERRLPGPASTGSPRS